MDKFKHLIFFDGDCPLCSRAVRFILTMDKDRVFAYAPLQGETAKEELPKEFLASSSLDTLVLLQNYGKENEKTLFRGQAILRILWLAGGSYALLGWMSYFPPFIFDGIYRLIAKNRYKIFKTKKEVDFSKGQYLP